MFEEMMKIVKENLKYDINYYVKHNVKSPTLAKIQNEFGQDNDEFMETCKRLYLANKTA